MVGQQTDGGGDAALLAEQVDPDAPSGKRCGKIQLADLVYPSDMFPGQLSSKLLTVLVRQRFVCQAADLAVNPAFWRQARDQVHI